MPSSLQAGRRQVAPIDSENLRPRLYALPHRAHNHGHAHLAGEPVGKQRRKRKAAGRLPGHRRRRHRPHRPAPQAALTRTSTSRSARSDAARPRSTRSRSSTAGSCWKRRRSIARPSKNPFARNLSVGGVLLLSKEALEATGPRRQAPLDLSLRPQRHRHRPDRPPCPGGARIPGRQGLPPDDHRAEVRPQHPHDLGQRLRALAPATRSTSPRSTGSRWPATRARGR